MPAYPSSAPAAKAGLLALLAARGGLAGVQCSWAHPGKNIASESIFLGRVWPNPDDPREPQWLAEDFEAAIAWQQDQENRCPGCGRPRDECFADDGPDYRATALVCWACREKVSAARKFTGDEAAGVYVVVEAETEGG